LAFARFEATGVIVPPGRRVFLLDARLVLSALTGRANELGDCLSLLRRRGTVAIFHAGRARQFHAVRDALGHLADEMPLLCIDRTPHKPTNVLWRAASTLNRNKAKLDVITSDADLADESQQAGFGTWLIAPGSAKGPLPKGPRHFTDLAKFKEYLAAQPIPE